MSKKRRTRKQKVSAKHKAISYTLSLDAKEKKVKGLGGKKDQSLFAYDPKLIRTDLTKTGVLSILAIATIVVIFLFRII